MSVQNGWSTQAPPTSPTQSRAPGKVKTDSQSTASSAGTADDDYLYLKLPDRESAFLIFLIKMDFTVATADVSP